MTKPQALAGLSRRAQLGLEKHREERLERETVQLLAAGFTRERIEWLRRRTEELKAQRLQLGAASDPYMARYMTDPDLDLRTEIGEDEYFRYRQATGRVLGIPVSGLERGSVAALAGLADGDEVLALDGRSVYNPYDLEYRASQATAGTMLLDVRRNGQIVQVQMPAGPVGLPVAGFSMATVDSKAREMKSRHPESAAVIDILERMEKARLQNQGQ
jgi:hypothetical protein